MISRFKQYLVEEDRVVYFTFGRMNPPTIGHGKLINKLAAKAGSNPYKIYLSQSHNTKKDPIPYLEKVKHVRKMFPKHARQIIINKKVITPFHALSDLYDQGFRKVFMIAGSDRVSEYQIRLNKYNGKKGAHGFYNFDGGVQVLSAGQRDADAEGAEGASGTKQREYALNKNFAGFAQGLPTTMSNADAKRLFNDVRKGMGLKEAKDFKRHIQLEPVSELREAYIRDHIFEEGERVVITKHGIVGNIKHLGTNYLIVESKGETWRCWLDEVSKVDPNARPHHVEADYGATTETGPYKLKESVDWVCGKCSCEPCICGNITEAQKWKKGGPDGEVHTQHKGETWRVRKNYDHNDRHTGEYRIEVKKKNPYGGHDWEWHDTVHGKEHAKSRLPEENQPEWGTPESTRKAKKMTPGEATTPQDKDIADRKGTQPARYHKGLSKATKIARDRQFKKQTKMADNDPAAYKPAPGDKTAETKPSKHTTFVRRMMGEQVKHRVDVVKKRVEREKQMDKIKHDRMMDRARMRDTIKKNQETNPMKEYGGPPISRKDYLKQKPMQEASFEDKSKASGISVGTLKKVYQRGVAAWKTGHRPGTTPSQWGHARVNAFITKKKKGGLNHDKDLA